MRTSIAFSVTPLKLAILLVSLLALSSCSPYVKQLSRAQELYNQAIDEEKGPDSVADSILLRDAYKSLQDALKGKDVLEKQGLLLNAYRLAALTEWQLRKYEQAKKSAESALALEPSPQDELLMKAIPAFIATEEVDLLLKQLRDNRGDEVDPDARKFYETNIFNPSPRENAKIEGAYQTLGALREQAQALPDIKLARQLLGYEMAALQVWKNGLSYLWENDATGAHNSFMEEQQQLIDTEERKLRELARRLGGGA